MVDVVNLFAPWNFIPYKILFGMDRNKQTKRASEQKKVFGIEVELKIWVLFTLLLVKEVVGYDSSQTVRDNADLSFKKLVVSLQFFEGCVGLISDSFKNLVLKLRAKVLQDVRRCSIEDISFWVNLGLYLHFSHISPHF